MRRVEIMALASNVFFLNLALKRQFLPCLRKQFNGAEDRDT